MRPIRTVPRCRFFLGLVLTILVAGVVTAHSQATKTFTGKISEIAKGMELDVGKTGTFYVLRLEEYSHIEFRLSTAEAVKSGVVASGGPTEILTPKKSTGLGWKVNLTCDANATGPLNTPVYKVLSVKRLGD